MTAENISYRFCATGEIEQRIVLEARRKLAIPYGIEDPGLDWVIDRHFRDAAGIASRLMPDAGNLPDDPMDVIARYINKSIVDTAMLHGTSLSLIKLERRCDDPAETEHD